MTICTQHRRALFGRVAAGEMILNQFGEIILEEWTRTGELRPQVSLDAFVIMPNHIHGILFILGQHDDSSRATGPVAPTGQREPRLRSQSVGAIIGQFKSAAAKRINRARSISGVPVWQRNYYEHIIRSDRSLERIREYIEGNPARWHEDRYFVEAAVRA